MMAVGPMAKVQACSLAFALPVTSIHCTCIINNCPSDKGFNFPIFPEWCAFKTNDFLIISGESPTLKPRGDATLLWNSAVSE